MVNYIGRIRDDQQLDENALRGHLDLLNYDIYLSPILKTLKSKQKKTQVLLLILGVVTIGCLSASFIYNHYVLKIVAIVCVILSLVITAILIRQMHLLHKKHYESIAYDIRELEHGIAIGKKLQWAYYTRRGLSKDEYSALPEYAEAQARGAIAQRQRGAEYTRRRATMNPQE